MFMRILLLCSSVYRLGNTNCCPLYLAAGKDQWIEGGLRPFRTCPAKPLKRKGLSDCLQACKRRCRQCVIVTARFLVALPVRLKSSADERRRVRFGDFALDRHSGELRKRGIRIRLQEQPFQILLVLLENPGELITREHLSERLWPDGTFVDFENGINTAVKKLRAALGDDAEAPLYIETLPRRGYRFIGAVEDPPRQNDSGGNEPA